MRFKMSETHLPLRWLQGAFGVSNRLKTVPTYTLHKRRSGTASCTALINGGRSCGTRKPARSKLTPTRKPQPPPPAVADQCGLLYKPQAVSRGSRVFRPPMPKYKAFKGLESLFPPPRPHGDWTHGTPRTHSAGRGGPKHIKAPTPSARRLGVFHKTS